MNFDDLDPIGTPDVSPEAADAAARHGAHLRYRRLGMQGGALAVVALLVVGGLALSGGGGGNNDSVRIAGETTGTTTTTTTTPPVPAEPPQPPPHCRYEDPAAAAANPGEIPTILCRAWGSFSQELVGPERVVVRYGDVVVFDEVIPPTTRYTWQAPDEWDLFDGSAPAQWYTIELPGRGLSREYQHGPHPICYDDVTIWTEEEWVHTNRWDSHPQSPLDPENVWDYYDSEVGEYFTVHGWEGVSDVSGLEDFPLFRNFPCAW